MYVTTVVTTVFPAPVQECLSRDRVHHVEMANGMIIARSSKHDGHVCCVQWYTSRTETSVTFDDAAHRSSGFDGSPNREAKHGS